MTKRFLLFIAAGEPDGKTPLVKRGLLAMAAENGQAAPNSSSKDCLLLPCSHFTLGKTVLRGCIRTTHGSRSCGLSQVMFPWHNLNSARLSIPGEGASAAGLQRPGSPGGARFTRKRLLLNVADLTSEATASFLGKPRRGHSPSSCLH